MIQNGNKAEQVLAQLKTQTATYIELPFNTGDFLLIAHYKLIAHYRQMLKHMEHKDADQNLPTDQAYKRKELEVEVLFQLDKVLALTQLSEEQLETLRAYKAMHEQLLQE
jgi:hypothetical protein